MSAEGYLSPEDLQVLVFANTVRESKSRLQRLARDRSNIDGQIEDQVRYIEETERLINLIKSRFHISVKV